MKENHLTAGTAGRALRWPDDPETVTAQNIDFTALAHVLANTCRRGGRLRRFYSIAQHAVVMSEEIDALDGLAPEDRRVLALHALLSEAPTAWLGDAAAGGRAGAKATERAKRDGAAIIRAVRAAAGLDGEPDKAHGELLRFIAHMTEAAERRDLCGPEDVFLSTTDGGIGFPPLKRRIRGLPPDRAAAAWLARCRDLMQPPRESGGAAVAGNPNSTPSPQDEETNDVAFTPEQDGTEGHAPRTETGDEWRTA